MKPAGTFKLEHLRGSRDGIGAEIISHTFFLLIYAFFIYVYIYNFYYLFIVGSAGSSLLCGLFFSCGERGLLCCSARASPCGSCSCFGAQALGRMGSVVVAHELRCYIA